MRQRGRKSAAQLTVFPGGASAGKRPEPPQSLTQEQQDEWWAVVNRMPPDWFPRETHAMLAQYCRHVVRADDIAKILDKMARSKNLNPKVYTQLLNQEQAQSKVIYMLATKMRISQQSSYDKSKRRNFNPAPPPWEDDDESSDNDDN